ncbi:MAG: C39 family peptidase [Rubrivivax sp.]|jgi:hypothetical protein
MRNPIPVPYQRQRDNDSGEGWRECFSSSVAMVAMHWGAVADDNAYNRRRELYGDTTNPQAHVRALHSLGLRSAFRSDLRRAEVLAELAAGRPVPVGWLHQGPSWSPRGGGHWSVLIGTTDTGLIVHDPFGDPDLIRGGWIPGRSGQSLRFSWRNFGPRWEVEGPGSGWGLLIRRA